MPYYVYKISPPLRLTPIDTKESYKDARALVRQLRQEHTSGRSTEGALQYRMIFANSQAEAEKLLSTPRDERVIGED